MCNLALIQNQYAPQNVKSLPYSKSISTTSQDLDKGPSACKLSVQTTTSKETRQNAATAPINFKMIHSFWVLRGFVITENRKNLSIDWEKMFAIHLKLE